MSYTIAKNIEEMVALRKRLTGKVAVVPTMGALHDGHLSLVKIARQQAEHVLMSIFVNPTQFGPNEDFEAYPRDLEKDLQKGRSAGVDVFFTPEVSSMYPGGFATYVVPESPLIQKWEGAARPGHFKGVATIVLKLFNVLQPHVAVFGLKDFQQLLVIRKMVADLNVPIEIIGAPIHREVDGLAMSSRNVYLSPQERVRALGINRSLKRAQKAILEEGQTDLLQLTETLKALIVTGEEVSIEYALFVHPETLEPQKTFEEKTLFIVTAKVGRTRLLDNILIQK
ncbi:pantoate--beta-alanine ligase [Deltaproteobacteria bacterium TL4]